MTRSAFAGALALALVATQASAAADPDLEAIRKEIADLKANYEARIQALEKKLQEAEARANVPAPVSTPAPAGAASSLSAFNPAVSVVLQGRYANLSQDPAQFAIAGFPAGGETGPGRRGFSLGESELAMFANVDHLFAGNLIVSLSPEDTVSVEEAYGIYLGAPYGVTPKFGRFFSGIGYLNEQHQHAWDFVDAPLAYQAFLGGQYAQDGVQFKWVAPIEQFVEVGAEIGNGDRFPGGPRDKNGAGSGAAYVHTGGDVGDSHSWRAGLSYLHTRTDAREMPFTDAAGDGQVATFAGRTHTAIADFVWKWSPHGNPRETNFKVQGEYFWRKEDGDLTAPPFPGSPGNANGIYSARQSGWYLQGVYQWMPTWRVGVRYDRLDPGTIDDGANGAFFPSTSFRPERYTAMVDWSPSEFSRVRLQVAQSRTLADLTDNQFFVQYILSLGAHGAHKY